MISNISSNALLTISRPELLEDDPAFIPGLDLMNLNLDNLNFGQLNIDSTMLLDDPQSSLSPHSTQLTDASQQSIGGLMLPPSASSFQGGPVGGSDLFGLRGNSESGANVQPARMLEDDLFVVGDDGTMNFDDIPIRQPSAGAKQTQPSAAKDRGNENPDFHMVCMLRSYLATQLLMLSSLIKQWTMASCQLRTTSMSMSRCQTAGSSTRPALRLQLPLYATRESREFASCP